MKYLGIVVVLLALAMGCAGTKVQPPEGTKKGDASVEPAQSYEDCMDMTQGNVMTYSFKSSAPLDFNIHFHEAGQVNYAVQNKNTAAENGKFLPDRKQTYCLMWTNGGSAPVKVEYSYKVENK